MPGKRICMLPLPELGTMSDKDVAAIYGVRHLTILINRRKRGIPAFKKEKKSRPPKKISYIPIVQSIRENPRTLEEIHEEFFPHKTRRQTYNVLLKMFHKNKIIRFRNLWG